ncbi:APC family permease [soil metagenome]
MSQLNRRFTPIHALLLSINGILGSAWLFAPLYAAKIAGPTAIIAWLLGGAATVLIAFTFAELSSLLPVAGGTTRFPQLSHGAITSFIISWVSWLSCVTMPPIEVQATLQYASIYFPWLTHIVHGVPQLTSIGLLFATLLMFILCIINVVSMKGLIRFNFLIFIFKISIIVLTIIMLMTTSFHTANFADMKNAWTMSGWQAILTAVASGGIAFAFTGFKHGVELAGETKNSALAIPLAIIGSVVCCLVLYLGLQIAFIGALNPAAINHGWNSLNYVGDTGPFVGIAILLGLGWLAKLLYFDAVASPLGAGLIYVTSTSRIIYAMSKNGYLPPTFSRLNQQHLPVWAIGLNFVIGMFLFLPLPGWQAMVSFLVSAVVISYAMGPIALVCLRLQLPDEKRSFRLPAATPICLLGFYCCNLISYWTGWETISKLSIAIAIGISLLAIACWRGSLDKTQLGWKALLWLVPYFAGLMTISYLGSFGGKNIITFGWDFLVIALFSIGIMLLAVISRLRSTTAAQFLACREEEVYSTS